jgi:hypothetical protein
MSFHALDYVLELTEAPNGEELSAAEKLILLVLAHCHNGHRRAAWPSVEKMAREGLTTERNARRILRELERKAIVRSRRPERQGRGQYTEYSFPAIDDEKGGSNVPLPPVKGGRVRPPSSQSKGDVSAPLFDSEEGGRKGDGRGTEGGRGEPRNKEEQELVNEGTKTKAKALATFALPDWIDAKLWAEYEEMRKTNRKPMTDKARELAVHKLDAFRKRGISVEAVIEQSIFNSWQGLFEPKGDGDGRRNTGNGTSPARARVNRIAENFHRTEALIASARAVAAPDAPGDGQRGAAAVGKRA